MDLKATLHFSLAFSVFHTRWPALLSQMYIYMTSWVTSFICPANPSHTKLISGRTTEQFQPFISAQTYKLIAIWIICCRMRLGDGDARFLRQTLNWMNTHTQRTPHTHLLYTHTHTNKLVLPRKFSIIEWVLNGWQEHVEPSIVAHRIL